MAIRSPKDINDAFAAGRVHTQFFLKNAGGSSSGGQWEDWGYTSGFPALDPRLGVALAMTPQIATGNKAIYFPPKSAGMDRHLIGASLRPIAASGSGFGCDSVLFDLLAVYPLIDGDSNDLQEMDNSASLPRYSSGVGVRLVMVNQIAPAVNANQPIVINYRGADDVDRNLTVFSRLEGIGRASVGLSAASTGPTLYLPTLGGGVKRINNLQFTGTAPSGLWAIYLVRPITVIENRPGVAAGALAQASFAEKCFCSTQSFDLPKIDDGAHLSLLYTTRVGAGRSINFFGSLTFIWG
jgi:hypothetical protein